MWKTIKKYPVYEINECGDVRNKETNHILRPKVDRKGYVVIGLYYNKKKYYPSIHRLVALTFIKNDNPINNNQVNHKDGNKLNNHVSNLEWCSGSYNVKHALATRLYNNSNHLVLTDLKTNTTQSFISIKELSRYLSISSSVITPYIKHSNKYPFLNRYVIKLKDESNMSNLCNTKIFGRKWFVYDYITRVWSEYSSFTALTYWTGLRIPQRSKDPTIVYRKDLGYIISYKTFKVLETLDIQQIKKARNEYYSIPYKPIDRDYLLYCYKTKQEFKFDNISDIADFVNNQEPRNIVYTKAQILDALIRSTSIGHNQLVKGYGINYTRNHKGEWYPYNLEKILASKYTKFSNIRCFELIYSDGRTELVISEPSLFKKLGLMNLRLNYYTPEQINRMIVSNGITVKRLDYPI